MWWCVLYICNRLRHWWFKLGLLEMSGNMFCMCGEWSSSLTNHLWRHLWSCDNCERLLMRTVQISQPLWCWLFLHWCRKQSASQAGSQSQFYTQWLISHWVFNSTDCTFLMSPLHSLTLKNVDWRHTFRILEQLCVIVLVASILDFRLQKILTEGGRVWGLRTPNYT